MSFGAAVRRRSSGGTSSSANSSHVPRLTGSPVKPFGRFLRQTTDASTLHPNVPALKVVSRWAVCVGPRQPTFVGSQGCGVGPNGSSQSIRFKFDCDSLSTAHFLCPPDNEDISAATACSFPPFRMTQFASIADLCNGASAVKWTAWTSWSCRGLEKADD